MLENIDVRKMNHLMEQNEDIKTIINQLLKNHQTIVSTISHEIANPLTLINSSLQVIEVQHPEVKDFAGWNQTMDDLVFMRQLLTDLSAFNNGSTLRYRVFSLGKVLRNVAVSFAMTLEESGIEYKSFIDPKIGDYTGDETKLQEVFINLLKNAKEATPKNGHISLTARRSYNRIIVSITDDGCGIEEDKLESIFLPFTTYKPDGTGLGLSISKRILEAHQGTLAVTSAVGEGSTFTVTLPY